MYSHKTRGQHSGIVFIQSVFDSTIYTLKISHCSDSISCLLWINSPLSGWEWNYANIFPIHWLATVHVQNDASSGGCWPLFLKHRLISTINWKTFLSISWEWIFIHVRRTMQHNDGQWVSEWARVRVFYYGGCVCVRLCMCDRQLFYTFTHTHTMDHTHIIRPSGTITVVVAYSLCCSTQFHQSIHK